MKLRERIYQAVMQINVLSPETSHIVEVDAVHIRGRQHHHARNDKGLWLYRGLRQWHDIRWMIRELGRSTELLERYAETSCEKQELADGLVEVGLTGSTLRTGKPATWGSGQQGCDTARNKIDTQKSRKHHG
jgi:hypothetical protein